MYEEVSGPLVFTINATGSQLSYGTEVVLIADGVNVPDFSAFQQLSTSDNYSNLVGAENIILFYRNAAGHYVYSISVGGTYDVINPTIVSATAAAANTVTIVFSEAVNATTLGWSFFKNAVALGLTSVSGAGTTWNFTVANFLPGDVLTYSYNDAVGNTADTAGNILLSVSNQAINNTYLIVENLVWADFSNTAGPGLGTLNGINATTPAGARGTKYISGNGFVEMHLNPTPANYEALVLCISAVNNTNYTPFDVTNLILSGLYVFSGIIRGQEGSTGATTFSLGAIGTYEWLRLERSGNDLLYKASTDGVTYTTLLTTVGLFAGVGNVYIKGVFASNAATKTMETCRGAGLA